MYRIVILYSPQLCSTSVCHTGSIHIWRTSGWSIKGHDRVRPEKEPEWNGLSFFTWHEGYGSSTLIIVCMYCRKKTPAIWVPLPKKVSQLCHVTLKLWRWGKYIGSSRYNKHKKKTCTNDPVAPSKARGVLSSGTASAIIIYRSSTRCFFHRAFIFSNISSRRHQL